MNSLNPAANEVEVKFLMSDIARVKRNFEQIIRDPDIDLHYRWKRFKEAPDCLKNHESYVPSFVDIDDICDRWDRNQTITALDFIAHLYGLFDDGEGVPPPVVTKINEIKEQFMQWNVGSFVYDW